jgi:predicted AAA+ superfamily ATPase
MIHHAIQKLLKMKVEPRLICYFSIDNPIYTGLGLEQLIHYYEKAAGVDCNSQAVYLFFDEIQYLRLWESHLKSLVDTYAKVRAIASGSAAAALRLKSTESGAGRFTDFLLPPLTFHEYLSLSGITDLFEPHGESFLARNIKEANRHFLDYLNFGGYPEAIFSPQIRSDPSRFIKSDIIDKVLLRDLPSLYGIQDIQELNHLFTSLAYNTAGEISLEALSQKSGVAKNTIKRYIQYLEAAFLIKIVHRVDQSGKRFTRANFFKVYLTNPSMRAALFSPVREGDDESISSLAETAVFSQWSHSETPVYYARWSDGEVDMVMPGPKGKIRWAVEVKWSDRYCEHPEELKSMLRLCHANNLSNLGEICVTSRTKTVTCKCEDVVIPFIPASTYCYMVGYNLVGRKVLTTPMRAGTVAGGGSRLP